MADLARYCWQFSTKEAKEQEKSATVHPKGPLLQEPACTKLMGNCSPWLPRSQWRVGVEGEGTLRAHQVERQEKKKKQKGHAIPKGIKKNAKLNLD